MEIQMTGKQFRDLKSLPKNGMHGGPLVSVVVRYEDGSTMHLPHDA